MKKYEPKTRKEIYTTPIHQLIKTPVTSIRRMETIKLNMPCSLSPDLSNNNSRTPSEIEFKQNTNETPRSELVRMKNIAGYSVSRQMIRDLIISLKSIDRKKNFALYANTLMKIYRYVVSQMKTMKPQLGSIMDNLLYHIKYIRSEIKMTKCSLSSADIQKHTEPSLDMME